MLETPGSTNKENKRLEEVLHVREGEGVFVTQGHTYELRHDFRGNGQVAIGKKDLAHGITYKGYLGVCGILTLSSAQGTTKMFLHGYFPNSLATLTEAAKTISPPNLEGLYSAKLHIANKDSNRANTYMEISQKFLDNIGVNASLQVILHEQGEVEISI